MEKRVKGTGEKTEFRWYLTPNLPTWRAVALGAAGTALCLGLYLSSWGEALETRFIRPLAFSTRHLVGRDPKVDPRIKIYAMDDRSVEQLKATDLDFKDWAEIMALFAPANPRSIFIDRVFAMPSGPDLASHREKIKRLPYPVIAGAYTTPEKLSFRVPLDITSPIYDLEKYVAAGKKKEAWDPNRVPWTATDRFYYGPNPEVRDAFTAGHLQYDGDYFVQAMIRINEKLALPSAALLAARGNLYLDDGELFIDGKRVPLDARGRVLVNLPHPEVYYKQTYTMAGLVKRIREKDEIPPLPKDAVVILLPGLFTGDTDRAVTPFGILPGGYVMATLISSALSGQWIRFMPLAWALVLLMGVLGTLAGTRWQGSRFLFGVGAAVILLVFGGLATFSYASFEVPWFFTALAFLTTAILTFGAKTVANEKKVRRLKELLEGTVAPAQLRDILRQPETLSLKPTGRVVTIMFVDIVGFSLTVERQDAKDAFAHLKHVLADLTEAVHEFGGVVDKTLGDGLLAFFGYRYDGTSDSGHALAALKAGMKIQRLVMDRNLKAVYEGRPVFPVRIGLNTAHVFIGDLGNSRRIDLTVVGHGVNLAKRLETACDTDCLMLGKDTYDMLSSTPDLPLFRRYIQIKHHSELVEAYECDPFVREPHLRAKSQESYRQFSGVSRMETRVLCPEHPTISVASDFARGRLLDYSGGGLSVLSDTYLGVGVTLNLTMHGKGDALETALRGLGLLPLLCEVRWGRPASDGGYRLGLSIKGLSPEKKNQLVRELDHIARISVAA